MSTRTTQSLVRFSSPFLLYGFDTPQPAGEYRIEHDDELIEGLSWLAYRRVACQSARKLDPISASNIDPLGAAVARSGSEPPHSAEPVRADWIDDRL